MKVLVIDHETFLAELVKLALEADGHTCFTVTGLTEAREILHAVRIDLLTLDLAIDRGDPLGWLEEVLPAHPGLQGRVFCLTGSPLAEETAHRVAATGARVIQKPFTLHQLRETIRRITPAAKKPPEPRPRGPVIET